jgi:GxGYxYP putative glycoside hydrolase C-terminal domain/Secretion system C-terminal sorting domain
MVLNQYVSKTEDYIKRAGFRVLTVWNTITGDINQNVGESYAQYAPSLLGITSQNTSGTFKIYKNSLPAVPLSCNYCTGEQPMEDAIAAASSGFNGAEPRFILIQAQPWQGVTPTSFKDVMNSLDTNHIVVRPDQFFQLIRAANGLPADSICGPASFGSAQGKTDPGGKNAISLYPNPVGSKIYIAGLKSYARLEVYSITGQYLLGGTGTSIEVGALSPGTYVIRVSSGDTTQTYKFIKQ